MVKGELVLSKPLLCELGQFRAVMREIQRDSPDGWLSCEGSRLKLHEMDDTTWHIEMIPVNRRDWQESKPDWRRMGWASVVVRKQRGGKLRLIIYDGIKSDRGFSLVGRDSLEQFGAKVIAAASDALALPAGGAGGPFHLRGVPMEISDRILEFELVGSIPENARAVLGREIDRLALSAVRDLDAVKLARINNELRPRLAAIPSANPRPSAALDMPTPHIVTSGNLAQTNTAGAANVWEYVQKGGRVGELIEKVDRLLAQNNTPTGSSGDGQGEQHTPSAASVKEQDKPSDQIPKPWDKIKEKLTPDELAILELWDNGLSCPDIGARIARSESRVRNIVADLRRQFGVGIAPYRKRYKKTVHSE